MLKGCLTQFKEFGIKVLEFIPEAEDGFSISEVKNEVFIFPAMGYNLRLGDVDNECDVFKNLELLIADDGLGWTWGWVWYSDFIK